jgi:hypothetical protein
MTTGLTNSDLTTLVFVALFVLLIGRRVVMMVRGAPVRPERMFAFAILFTALLILVLGTSLSQLPLWTFGLDAIAAVAAAVSATIGVRRRVVFELRNGVWYYRVGVGILILYLALFVTRLALDAVVLGVDPFALMPPSAGSLTSVAGKTVAIINGLFAVSTGLLVGRTIGIYLEYRKRLAEGPSPATASPLPPA